MSIAGCQDARTRISASASASASALLVVLGEDAADGACLGIFYGNIFDIPC